MAPPLSSVSLSIARVSQDAEDLDFRWVWINVCVDYSPPIKNLKVKKRAIITIRYRFVGEFEFSVIQEKMCDYIRMK